MNTYIYIAPVKQKSSEALEDMWKNVSESLQESPAVADKPMQSLISGSRVTQAHT